jgi:hypothetical protein
MIASPGAVAGEPVTNDRAIAAADGAEAEVGVEVDVAVVAEVVRWPAEAGRRAELAAQGRPRVLLVEAGAVPPPLAPEEDWLRLPAPPADLRARRTRLARRFPR